MHQTRNQTGPNRKVLVFHRHHKRNSLHHHYPGYGHHHHGMSKSSIERLATPKQKDPRWLPDRPSVYWLDYLIDQTPHRITDPEELAGYYNAFEPKYPRTHSLSAPRKYFGMLRRDEDSENKYSKFSGIPLAVLSYTPTDRIKKLATPKPETATSRSSTARARTTPRTGTSSSKRSVYTANGRGDTAQGRVRVYEPNYDLARGDYNSRSQHGMQSVKKDGTSSAESSKPGSGTKPRNAGNNSTKATRSRFTIRK